MNLGTPKGQKMSCGSLDLGLQVFVSYSTWVLGTKLRSPVGSMYTPNHSTVLQSLVR